jgi:NAD(P)-dependent dehydrogenase (short-subunit alcohol dehydrogenase family)
MDTFQPVGEVDDAVWERVFAVNVDAVMRLTRAIVPAMLASGRGSVVNVASEASLRGSCAGVAYTASKHAVVGITRNSAVMYGKKGIRFNAVAPGAVATNIEATFASALGGEVLGPLLGSIPAMGQPEELAAAICFLLSSDAGFVNGAVLPVDAGWSAI